MGLLRPVFELLNESLVCVGCGCLGFGSVLLRGKMYEIIQYSLLSIAGVSSIIYMISKKQFLKMNENNVVLISGCDSGLGYNMALQCHSMNMTVIAGCLNTESEGANKLREICGTKQLRIIQLDTTKMDSIIAAREYVESHLRKNENYTFSALVNNAGVMSFGEFEWQTQNIINHQISVNLFGTMCLTKEFLPLLRWHKGRVINVTSHCSLQALPTVSVYSATKAALRFWNDSLRMEMRKYGVSVVNFIPGSFVMSSNITARQQELALEMKSQFTNEQLRYYGHYFDELNEYLQLISGFKTIEDMPADTVLMDKFQNALTHDEPYAVYKHEPLRYKVYHYLFKISPTLVLDWLVSRFVSLPAYKRPVPNPIQ